MTRIVLDLDCPCPPGRAVDALVDFSDRRPDLWPGLAREFYEVAWVGETSAEVREGSTKPLKEATSTSSGSGTPATSAVVSPSCSCACWAARSSASTSATC